MKRVTTILAICMLVVLLGAVAWGQTSQQVIGSFPQMDGGFEGQAASGALTSATYNTGTQSTVWTTSSTNQATFQSSSPRTGGRYVNVNYTSTTKRFQSPTAAADAIVAGTNNYTVQFYYRTSGATAPGGGNEQIGISSDGTNPQPTMSYTTISALTGTSGVWTKVVSQVSGISSTNPSPKYGYLAAFRTASAMTAAMDVDDVVMYAGAVDNTPPDSATIASAGSPTSSSLTVSWTAPSTGVDGGGYMIVRMQGSDPTTTPNANGIYAVGNTVATGEQVVYIGTGTSFTDNGLSSGTQYYYRIYTVDKAFNYSPAATANGTTSSPVTPVITVTGTLTDFGSVAVGSTSTEQSYTVAGTDLTANLVVTAPSADFEVSKTTVSGFSSSISFIPSGGSVPTSTVYVHFKPQSVGLKSGNISNASTGATTQNVAVSGTGIDVPALTAPTSSAVTTSAATLGGTISTDNGSTVTASGVAYATSPNPTSPTVATFPTITSGIFTVSVSSLSTNTLYHYRGYATNGAGTGYASDATFTTLPDGPVAVGASSVGATGFTANWNSVAGAEAVTYRLDVSTDNSFSSFVGGYQNLSVGAVTSYGVSGLSSSATYYYRVRAVNAGGTSDNSNTITVNTTNPIHNITQNTYYGTIQAAVDAANSGDEIDVAAGTFQEQVYINKNLILHGAGAASTTIIPPATLMSQPFLPDRAERPIIGVGPLGTNVTIEGFTVDGAGAGNTQLSMSGIQFFKASGIIRNNTVTRVRATPFDGTQGFIGIMANHDFPNTVVHSVEINNNTVEDFGKGGIVCNHPGLTANIHDNIVTGQGPTPLNAQNGIQLGWGATGMIAHNTVSGVVYTGTDWGSSGILAIATDGTADINNNTVTNAQIGIYLTQDYTYLYTGASSATLTSNTVSSSSADYYGSVTWSFGGAGMKSPGRTRALRKASPFEVPAVLQKGAGRLSPMSTMSVTYTGNTFTNSATSPTGAGVYLIAGDTSPQTASLTNNTMSGWGAGVVTDKDPGATMTGTLRHNVISGNTDGMDDVTGVLQDARQNWWGDPTGPLDGKALPGTPNYSNPTGLGNPVSSNIDYSPFYLDAARTTLSIYTLAAIPAPAEGGSVSKSPDQATYNHGTVVTLTANAAVGYHFDHWSGDASGSTNPLTFTMTGSKSITANFAQDVVPLGITSTSPLPNATAGIVYSNTLTATGGTPPYGGWQVISGSLPAGMSLDASTGVINGTPTVAATDTFTVQVSDDAMLRAGGSKGRNSTLTTATKQFILTVDPGTLHHFALGTVSSPQTAGTAFSLAMTAQDAYNNTVTSFTGTVTLSTTAGTITPPTSGSFALGVRNENVTVTQSGTGKTIGVDGGSGHTGTSNAFDVNPGALTHFAMGTISTPQVAGTAFSISMTALDANNNTVTGFTGTVGLTTTAGTIAPTTSGSFVLGVRNENVTVTLAGTGKTISVDDGSAHTGTSNTFDVNPGALDHFAIGTITSPQIQNTAFNLVMTAKDANNNTVTGFVSTVGISLSSGTIAPTTSGTFVSGTRTEPVTVSTGGTGLTIGVNDGAGHTGTSDSFDITVPTPYRSAVATSGNWNTPGSWEIYDGANWVPAVGTPTSSDGAITILAGDTIVVSAPITADQVAVEGGACLKVGLSQTLTIANGADSVDMVVSGTVNNYGTLTATGRVSFENGGLYVNSIPGGGTIPLMTWRTGSTCKIDSCGTNGPANLNAEQLYNLVWNGTTQAANGGPNFPDGSVIAGDLTVTGTNNVQFRLINVSAGTTRSVFIRGNVNVSGATTILTATGSGADASAKTIVNVDGNINVTGGTWSLTNSSAALTEWKVKGNISITGGTLQSNNGGTAVRRFLTFTGGGTQNFTVTSPGTIGNATTTFKVSNNSTVNVNFPWTLMAGGAVNLESGRFATTGTNFLSIPPNGTITSGSASSYVDGPLIMAVNSTSPTSRTFPIGKGGAYRPVTLTVNHLVADTTRYKAEMFNTAPATRTLPGTLSSVSSVRYVNIAKLNGSDLSPTLGATVQLSYDVDDGVTDSSKVRVAKDSSNISWLNLGGSGTASSTGSITSNAFYSFSDFVLATAAEGASIIPPTVTTTAMSYISTTFATSGGNVTNDGGAPVTARGVCWNTDGNPTTADPKTSDGTGAGVFTSSLTGLTPGLAYHVRAYATNSSGTGYGTEVVFSTLAAIGPPTVTTTAISNIQVTTAVSGGNVTDWGGDAVIARGICWNTTGTPTLANSYSVDGSGLGSFTSGLSPLVGGATYYVRAYASNSVATGYGNEVSFTTQLPQPDVTVTVAQDGSGDYLTVQAAFNAVPTGYTGKWTIFVRNGVYYEKLLLASGKINVVLQGESRDNTILTYDDYADRYGSGNPGTSGSYSVAIDASDFTARDITFRNTYSPQPGVTGTQAVALRTQGDRHEYINCRMLGYQDTYYTWGGGGAGRMYHKDCFIEGSVDFIFGRNICVFDNCTIHEIRGNGASLTAGATDPTSLYGYVFRNCTIRADSIGYDGQPITSFYLGRPWQASPRTVFINNFEPWNLNPAGWLAWNVTPALYAEFNCYGPGSTTGGRVAWSSQLTGPAAAAYSLSNIFSHTSASSSLILYDWMPANAANDLPLPMRIVASAGTHGTISPDGTTNVSYNGSQVYAITAAQGYHVDTVYVDGTPIGAVTSHTFTGVIANHTISAVFAQNAATEFALTIHSDHGTVTKNPDSLVYAMGTWVHLTANPSTGYHFVNWTDSLVSSNNPDSIQMTSDKVVTANFAINRYSLNVATIGNGTVSKDPDSTDYPYGLNVTLTANAASGWYFAGWRGDTVTTANPVVVVMNRTKNDTATFSPITAVKLSNGTGGGLWANASTWAAGIVPLSTDSVVIVGTDSVTVASGTTCAGLNVLAGGKLALLAKLTPTNVTLDGKIVVSVDTLRQTGTMIVGGAGVYQHAENAGRIPTASWTAGSTLLLTGITSVAPQNGRQTFRNVVWNSPGQSASLNLGWASPTAGVDTTINVNGDITVLSTGTGRWQFSAPQPGSAGAHSVARINIGGKLSVSGGSTLTSNGTSNGFTDIIITINGNVSVRDSATQLSISRGSQGGTGTATWVFNGDSVFYGRRTVNQNSTDANTAATSKGKFVFSKPGTQYVYVDSANSWSGECNMFFGDSVTATTVNVGNSQFLGSAITQRIRSNATVIIGPQGFIGGGTNSNSIPSSFTMDNGSTLVIGSPDGIGATGSGSSGAVRVSGTRNYGTSTNFEYNGVALQVTGSGLPALVGNLTINNASGVSLSQATTVANVLNLGSSKLTPGVADVTIGNGGSVVRSSGYVVDRLKKRYQFGSNTRSFEIGDATSYSPVEIVFNGASADSGTLTVTTVTGDHPQIANSVINPARSVNRYYTVGIVKDNGFPIPDCNVTFTYASGDLDAGANPDSFIVGRYESSAWTYPVVSVRTPLSIQAIGVTSFGDFAIGEFDTLPPSITYNLVGSTGTPGVQTLVATIRGGVDTRPVARPRLWYRTGTVIPMFGDYNDVSGVAVSGDTTWSFTFPSLASGSFVEYYVAAQDGAQNVTTEPAGTAYTPNPPNGTVAAPNRFVVKSPLTFTVGGSDFPSITEALTWFYGGIDGPVELLLDNSYTSVGEVYPIFIGGIPGLGSFASAAKAGGKHGQSSASAMNVSGKSAKNPVLANKNTGVNGEIAVPDDISSIRPKLNAMAMNARRIPGLGVKKTVGDNVQITNTLTIKPNTGATPGPISGTAAYAVDFTILWLDAVSGVTIDGLTIANAGDGPTVFISDGASNNRIINSTLKGVTGAGNAVGIVWMTDNVLPVNCTNNTFANCTFTDNGGGRPYAGITFFSFPPVMDVDDTVRNCTFQNFGPGNASGGEGIWVLQSTSGLVLEGNDFSFTSPGPGFAAASYAGIFLGSSAAGPVTGTIVRNNVVHDMDVIANSGLLAGISAGSGANVDGALLEGNTIRDLGATTPISGSGVRGFYVAGGLNQTFTRNTVKDLQNALAGGTVIGLRISGAAGGQAFKTTWTNNMIVLGNVGTNTNVGYLGISDNGNTDDTAYVAFNSIYIGGVSGGSTTACYNRSAASVVTLRDNIFMSEREGGVKNYAIRSTPATGAGIFSSNYNDLYVTGATTGVLGSWAATDQPTLLAWQTASSGDANSLNADPIFVDPTVSDLHIRAFLGDLSPVADAGIPYDAVTVDIDNQAGHRTTTPDIGADEFELAAPFAFLMQTPVNGAVEQPVAGTLTWDPAVGATKYDVYLDTNPVPVTLYAADVTGPSAPYTGLSTDLTYYWTVVAKNLDSSTVATGAPFHFATIISTVSVNVPLGLGWNMISNPVTVADDTVLHLYPTSFNPYVYFFSSGYLKDTTMENGKGYWGKFPAAVSQPVTGMPRTRDSISVIAGWNMIGTISNAVDTSTIVSDPAGLRATNWFGFTSGVGYTPATTLTPGLAYWVKTNAPGKFVLANPIVTKRAKGQAAGVAVEDVLNSLTVTDSKGHAQTLYFGADANNEVAVGLYAMPPAPPVGAMDVRFATAEGGSMVRTHEVKVTGSVEFPVTVQSDAYPLTISWNVGKGTASYELTDGMGGQSFLAKEMRGEGSLKVTSAEVSRFSVRLVGDGTLPVEYALWQNYPNPFNPTTNIKYALPVESRVTMEVYNTLGQRVRTLVNDNKPAGYHVAGWDGKGNTGEQMATGVYFLRLTAAGTNGKTFTEVRKLMMLK